jgi:hypothetical protein
MSKKGMFFMRWLFLIFFLVISNHYFLDAMPGAAESDSAEESGDSGGNDSGGNDSSGDDSGGGDSGGDGGDTQQAQPAPMFSSNKAGLTSNQAPDNTPIIESKRLEGPDIILLEKEKNIVTQDNPEIIRLSGEVEAKLDELDQGMQKATDNINEQQAVYREISEKRKDLYQSIRTLMGRLKELVAPEDSKSQAHDSSQKVER